MVFIKCKPAALTSMGAGMQGADALKRCHYKDTTSVSFNGASMHTIAGQVTKSSCEDGTPACRFAANGRAGSKDSSLTCQEGRPWRPP